MNELNNELDNIKITADDEFLITKNSTKKVGKEFAKSAFSMMTGGFSDIFFNMLSVKSEINEDIRRWKLEKLFDEYICINDNQERQIKKLKQLSAPYGYILVRESINIIDDKPYDIQGNKNIAEIIDRICSTDIEHDDIKYYEYINLLHYTRVLSPYALKIIKDIQTSKGLLNRVKFTTKKGDYNGSNDTINKLFLKNYHCEHNYDGYRFGIIELINGGHLKIYSNGESLHITIPETTKMLNLYLTGDK